MEQKNHQRELEMILATLSDVPKPRLLLHCCCAPCSSYVLEYLDPYFAIDLYFYNPNIDPPEEYVRRREELWRLSDTMGVTRGQIEQPYDSAVFYEAVRGLESLPEGDVRCRICYELRLRRAAEYAAVHDYNWFSTTLTISPHKDAAALNEIGARLGEEYGVAWLPSDFKKKNGYRRSLELSRQYGLYRQDYCGCAFSRAARGG